MKTHPPAARGLKSPGRKLFYVPVVHSAADMGTLAAPVARAYRARYGNERRLRKEKAIREMWAGIEKRLESLGLDFRTLKVYQDGLPVCGQEEEIVRDLAERGSANHSLLARLIDQGARLVGTESPGLLLREYEIAKAQLAGGAGARNGAEAAQQRAVLEERDRFIARRIDETLAAGETGILFIGILHGANRYLPPDVQVEVVIYRLPFANVSESSCPKGRSVR